MFSEVVKVGKNGWDRAQKFKWYDWAGMSLVGAAIYYFLQNE
jgi:hypothetical protein